MAKSGRLKTEEYFAVTRKREKQALKEKEKERQEIAEHVAKLRALRLAKEAAEKNAAQKAGAEKMAAKNKKPLRLPKSQRHG